MPNSLLTQLTEQFTSHSCTQMTAERTRRGDYLIDKIQRNVRMYSESQVHFSPQQQPQPQNGLLQRTLVSVSG